MGDTFLISRPRETPCEMFTVCSTGLGPPSEPLPRSGGGAFASATAIPVMLGAGASAAADDWSGGAAPPLTTRGDVGCLAEPSAAEGLGESDLVESDLVESGLAESGFAESGEAEPAGFAGDGVAETGTEDAPAG